MSDAKEIASAEALVWGLHHLLGTGSLGKLLEAVVTGCGWLERRKQETSWACKSEGHSHRAVRDGD